MKKIINGSVYDTSTAKPLGEYCHGHDSRDFGFWEETLYRTKAGKYFIHGWGGGNSKYGKWVGNSGGPGEEIRPYTLDEAKQWAEERLDGDEYEAIFGAVEETEDGTTTTNISGDAYRLLQRAKDETGKTIRQLVDDAVLRAYGGE